MADWMRALTMRMAAAGVLLSPSEYNTLLAIKEKLRQQGHPLDGLTVREWRQHCFARWLVEHGRCGEDMPPAERTIT